MAINRSIPVYSALSVCIDNHVLLRAQVTVIEGYNSLLLQ